MPRDSKKILAKMNGITPYMGTKYSWGMLKSATFDKQLTVTRKPFRLKLNRNLYALYQMVMLPMIFDDC